MSPLHLRRATARDASTLADLGARTFLDSYLAENDPEDMRLYVAANFTPDALAKDLADRRTTYFLGCEGAEPVCYAKLHQGPAPECVKLPAPIELSRFYVVRALHGKGTAKVLMNTCLVEAARLGARSVWLGVWEKNLRARAFYAKQGFEDVGVHEFVLGKDVPQDRVLARSLPAPPPPK